MIKQTEPPGSVFFTILSRVVETFVRYNDGIALKLNRVSIPTIDKQMIDRAQWEENNPNGKQRGLFARGLDTVKSSYKLILIISPGDEARLTPDDVYNYPLDHQ